MELVSVIAWYRIYNRVFVASVLSGLFCQVLRVLQELFNLFSTGLQEVTAGGVKGNVCHYAAVECVIMQLGKM